MSPRAKTRPCATCNATGQLIGLMPTESHPCPTCGGSGKLPADFPGDAVPSPTGE